MAAGTFVHQAVVYDDVPTLVSIVGPVVQAALDRGEAPIVVLGAENADGLRSGLTDAFRLDVVDPVDVYTRPWHTFANYVETVLARAAANEPILVVGEPPFAACDTDDAADWLRVESALNIALADVHGLMLCPYRRATAGDTVMTEMARVHPELRHRRGAHACPEYVDPRSYLAEARATILPHLGAPDWEMRFDVSELPQLRRAVSFEVELAGVDPARVPEFALAVNEVAANSVKWGGGNGTFRFWTRDHHVVCEVEDSGVLGHSPLGMLPPDADLPGGRGLWIARQFSDSLAIVSRRRGTLTRMRIATQ